MEIEDGTTHVIALFSSSEATYLRCVIGNSTLSLIAARSIQIQIQKQTQIPTNIEHLNKNHSNRVNLKSSGRYSRFFLVPRRGQIGNGNHQGRRPDPSGISTTLLGTTVRENWKRNIKKHSNGVVGALEIGTVWVYTGESSRVQRIRRAEGRVEVSSLPLFTYLLHYLIFLFYHSRFGLRVVVLFLYLSLRQQAMSYIYTYTYVYTL